MLRLKSPLTAEELALLRALSPLETVADEEGLLYALFWSGAELLVAQVALAAHRFSSDVGQNHVDADEATEHLG